MASIDREYLATVERHVGFPSLALVPRRGRLFGQRCLCSARAAARALQSQKNPEDQERNENDPSPGGVKVRSASLRCGGAAVPPGTAARFGRRAASGRPVPPSPVVFSGWQSRSASLLTASLSGSARPDQPTGCRPAASPGAYAAEFVCSVTSGFIPLSSRRIFLHPLTGLRWVS
jgi:hypothetical protein